METFEPRSFSRPGNRDMADVAGVNERNARKLTAKLIGWGLIERTEVGDGRKNASVYRICWESDHYPDESPGGKRFSNQVLQEDRDSNGNEVLQEDQDSNETRSQNLETGSSAGRNPVPRTEKMPETRSSKKTTLAVALAEHKQNSISAISARSEREISLLLKNLPHEYLEGSEFFHQTHEYERLAELCAKHTWQFVACAALYYVWSKEGRFDQDKKKSFRWTAFLDNWPTFEAKVTQAKLDEMEENRRRKDPEYEAKRLAGIQANIARQEAELNARRKAFEESEQKPVEISAEELLGGE
jgi:hypothetical protein